MMASDKVEKVRYFERRREIFSANHLVLLILKRCAKRNRVIWTFYEIVKNKKNESIEFVLFFFIDTRGEIAVVWRLPVRGQV